MLVPSNGNGDSQDAGGHGGNGPTTPRSSTEARLMRRALRENWPIKIADRALAVATLIGVMNDPHATNRERVGAARALGTLAKVNLDSVRTGAFIQRNVPPQNDAAAEMQRFLREDYEAAEREIAQLEALENEQRMNGDADRGGAHGG
jgi:hypothetical protein